MFKGSSFLEPLRDDAFGLLKERSYGLCSFLWFTSVCTESRLHLHLWEV